MVGPGKVIYASWAYLHPQVGMVDPGKVICACWTYLHPQVSMVGPQKVICASWIYLHCQVSMIGTEGSYVYPGRWRRGVEMRIKTKLCTPLLPAVQNHVLEQYQNISTWFESFNCMDCYDASESIN